MYSDSFCSEMSASLSLLESQMDEQDRGGGGKDFAEGGRQK